jgi:hypothetical protein
MVITDTQAFGGLFYDVHGEVRDIGIDNANIATTTACTGSFIGIVAALNEYDGAIDHVWTTGKITSRTPCIEAIGGVVAASG